MAHGSSLAWALNEGPATAQAAVGLMLSGTASAIPAEQGMLQDLRASSPSAVRRVSSAIGALMRRLRVSVLLLGITVLGHAGCSDSSTEPPEQTHPSVSGAWKGAARLDTLRFQLEEAPYYDWITSVTGIGTLTETATGSSSTFEVSGLRGGPELSLVWTIDPNKPNERMIYQLTSLEQDRMVGLLKVLVPDSTPVLKVQDSIGVTMIRQ